MRDYLFDPSQAKYRLEVEGIDMYADEFDVILAKSNGSFVKYVPKSELIHEVVEIDHHEKHEYYLRLDTTEFGQGEIVCIVRAYVPDSDFPGGKRIEVDQFVIANPKQLKVDISKIPHQP
jgi:hypothetical protein